MYDANLKRRLDLIFTEFVEFLVDRGLANSSISGYSQAIKHFLGYLVQRGIWLETVTEKTIMDFALDRFAKGNSGRTVDDYVYRVLFFLKRYGLNPDPNTEILALLKRLKEMPSIPTVGKAPIQGNIGYEIEHGKLKNLHKKFHPRG